MTSDKGFHLDENQLITAAVDLSDLPVSMQEHLSTCDRCMKELSSLENSLNGLGQKAEQAAPLPVKRIIIPPEETGVRALFSEYIRPAFSLAATVMILVFALWWVPEPETLPETPSDTLAHEMIEEDPLMAEVSSILENAMPEEYIDISGSLYTGFDEEFMQFVVPVINDGPVSQNSGMKGDLSC